MFFVSPTRQLTAVFGAVTVITRLTIVTVTLAVPLTPPLAAVTVNGPPAVLPAVKSPLLLIVPPPLTVQLKLGCGTRGLPN
jgi:hypothetical protein